MKKIAWSMSVLLVLSLHGALAAGTALQQQDSECSRLLDAKDYAQARPVCSASAEGGDAADQFHLSMMYAMGWGVAKDKTASLEWLQASANQGYPPAEYALSSRLAADASVPRDREEAQRLLVHAAEHGFLLAQILLGHAYEAGFPDVGIGKDMPRAVHWYRQAAAQCESCQYELWRIYYFGRGVDKDYTMAASHLIKAAEAGLPKAQMHLAFLYHDGEGVPKDAVKAYMWFFIAAKGGDPAARKALPLMAKKISRSQAAEARAMADKVMERTINMAQLCAVYQQFCKSR